MPGAVIGQAQKSGLVATDAAATASRAGWFAEALKAIRNPMIFNAFAIAVMSSLVYGGIQLEFNWFRGVFLGVAALFNIGLTAWLNYFASSNPRFLAYGPDEYIRESELDHERKLATAAGSTALARLPPGTPALPTASPGQNQPRAE